GDLVAVVIADVRAERQQAAACGGDDARRGDQRGAAADGIFLLGRTEGELAADVERQPIAELEGSRQADLAAEEPVSRGELIEQVEAIGAADEPAEEEGVAAGEHGGGLVDVQVVFEVQVSEAGVELARAARRGANEQISLEAAEAGLLGDVDGAGE